MSELAYNILLSSECLAHVSAERSHADTLSSQFLLGVENSLIICHITFNIISLTSLIVLKSQPTPTQSIIINTYTLGRGKDVHLCFASLQSGRVK